MTQGERVRKIRKSLSLTLEKFGEKIGMKKNSISQIENGINNLTDQMAKAICREFNVNYDYLIHGKGEMFSDLPQTVLDELCLQYKCDSLDRFLIECYLKLNADERLAIKKYMQSLSDSIAGNGHPDADSSGISENTVADAEAAYIKSRSNSARSTGLNASNTTGAGENEAAAG